MQAARRLFCAQPPEDVQELSRRSVTRGCILVVGESSGALLSALRRRGFVVLTAPSAVEASCVGVVDASVVVEAHGVRQKASAFSAWGPVLLLGSGSARDAFRDGYDDFVPMGTSMVDMVARMEHLIVHAHEGDSLREDAAVARELYPPDILDRVRRRSVASSRRSLDSEEPLASVPAVACEHSCISAMFADISGFTAMCKQVSSADVVSFMHSIFSAFDDVADRWGIYRAGIIGDCYFAVSGHRPDEDHATHAYRMLGMALELLGMVRWLPDGRRMRLRIGLHCGPATSGVLCMRRPKYTFFGTTINAASRMESTGTPDRVHLTTVARDLLIRQGGAPDAFKRLEPMEIKGLGRMDTYLYDDEKLQPPLPLVPSGRRSVPRVSRGASL